MPRILSITLLFLCAFALPLAALTVVPEPGVYSHDIYVVCSGEESGTLFYSLNGADYIPYTDPIPCTAAPTEEKTYSFAFKLQSSAEPMLTAVYIIDKKVPEAPTYIRHTGTAGTEYVLSLSEPGTIHVELFDPFSGARGTVMLDTAEDETLTVSRETHVVAWGTDRAGNRGSAVALRPDTPVSTPQKDSVQSDFTILNPVPGTWANMQTLVIESDEPMDFYYSATGTDPLVSGFAYDGPVLIAKTGEVLLSVTGITASGDKIEKNILYAVQPGAVQLPLASDDVCDCVVPDAEGNVVIPAGALYAVGGDVTPYIPARTLSLSGFEGKKRFLPLTISYKDSLFRSVISIPGETGQSVTTSGGAQPIPGLRILDWNFAEIRGNGMIHYSVNKGPWRIYDGPFYIDRSDTVLIEWYSDVLEDDVLWSVPLPPMPEITGVPASGLSNGAVRLTVPADGLELRYEIGFDTIPPAPDRNSPRTDGTLTIDTVYGDDTRVNVRVGVWFSGIRQGELEVSFTIDRKPPVPPEVVSDAKELYSREPVQIHFKGGVGMEVSVAEKKTVLEHGQFPAIPPEPSGKFTPMSASDVLTLSGDRDAAVTYTVATRSSDTAGNMSEVSLYTVTVDRNNFYISSSADSASGDGSPLRPFGSLEAAAEAANKRQFTRFFIEGSYTVSTPIMLTSSAEFNGLKNPHLEFSGNAGVMVADAAVTFRDCFLEQAAERNTPSAAADLLLIPLIRSDNAFLTIENCGIIVNGGISRAVCSASGGSMVISDSELSVRSDTYAVLVTARNANVTLRKVSGAINAKNGVCYSLTGGVLNMNDSSCAVNAANARVIEAFGARLTLTENVFTNALLPKTLPPAVWLDASASIESADGNTVSGFVLR